MIEQAIFVVGLDKLLLFPVESQLKRGAFCVWISQEGDFSVVLRYLSPIHKLEPEEPGVKVN
jgi:hypothetical protein